MRWPFQTEERKERHRKDEDQFRKREEATRRMADLFIRHYSIAAAEIISELERIHSFYEVPSWAPSGEPGGYLHQLVTELSQTSLTPEETRRLVAMLLWPELRAYKDRTATSCFVSAAMRNPSEAHIPILKEHLAWLEEEIKRPGSSQSRSDIASEIRLTKGAIQACWLRP